MPTSRSLLYPLYRSFRTTLFRSSNLRWVCPSCERRLQRYRPFTITSQHLNESKDRVTQEEARETSEAPAQDIVINEQPKNEAEEASYLEDKYEPATTWKGLERVGGKAWRRKRQVAKPFEGHVCPIILTTLVSQVFNFRFFSNTTEASGGDPSAAVHRAVVETLLMRGAGSQDITEFQKLSEQSDKAQITVSPDGRSVSLSVPQQDGKELSYEAISTSENDFASNEESSGTSTTNSKPILASENGAKREQSWANVPLRDPILKFTVGFAI